MNEFLRIKNKTITTPLLDIIKDIKENIYNGKLNTIKLNGNNITVSCPFHKNGLEHKASANVYIGEPKEHLDYGRFSCFACKHTGPFYHFVAGCFNISDEEAQKWLIENYGDDSSEEVISLPEILLTKDRKQYLDESILARYEDFHPYMIKRKISKEIIEKFQIKYDAKLKMIVFPVRDLSGKLLMLTRRSVIDKTFFIDKNKEKPLYLLYYMLENNITSIMITEGQIDALTAMSYGFPCIATMGNISDNQIESLNKSGIRVLYTMFDSDYYGKVFTENLINKLRKDILVINVPIIYPGKKDINDLNEAEFYECINQAKKIQIG